MHTHVQIIRYNFLYPPLSAIAPIIGDKIATTIPVIDIPLDHNIVPIISFSAITVVKNVPYINVITSVVKG